MGRLTAGTLAREGHFGWVSRPSEGIERILVFFFFKIILGQLGEAGGRSQVGPKARLPR